MGNGQRVLLQVGTALALAYLGSWVYRNPRKTLGLLGNWADQPLPQKVVIVLGSLCMFVGVYAAVLVGVGQHLPDAMAGLLAAAAGIAVVWLVSRNRVSSQ